MAIIKLCLPAHRINCASIKYLSGFFVSSQSRNSIRSLSNDSYQKPQDDKGYLVYEGQLLSKVKSVKRLSLSTSLMGLLLQSYIYTKSLQEGSTITPITLAISSTMVLLFSLTPLLINSITKRYVYKLYFEPKEKLFTAYSLSLINRPVITQFNKESFQLAPIASPFATIIVKPKKPFFIDIKEIKDPDALELFADSEKNQNL